MILMKERWSAVLFRTISIKKSMKDKNFVLTTLQEKDTAKNGLTKGLKGLPCACVPLDVECRCILHVNDLIQSLAVYTLHWVNIACRRQSPVSGELRELYLRATERPKKILMSEVPSTVESITG